MAKKARTIGDAAVAAAKRASAGNVKAAKKKAKGSSKLTISSAVAALKKQGYRLGQGSFDLRSKTTSYKVTGPNGRTRTMTADQVKKLVAKGSKKKSAKKKSAKVARKLAKPAKKAAKKKVAKKSKSKKSKAKASKKSIITKRTRNAKKKAAGRGKVGQHDPYRRGGVAEVTTKKGKRKFLKTPMKAKRKRK